MTRIDFYLLSDATEEAREVFACRLAHRAWRSGFRVLLCAADDRAATRLDEKMWEVPEDAFMPHEIATRAPAAPVAITIEPEFEHFDQVLINLAAEVPLMFSRFERVAEVVPQDVNARALSRERYRFYRDRGYPLQHHEISASTL